MKKLLFFILIFSPLSVFAGADTDKICADRQKYGLIHDIINVSYPGESIDINAIYKFFYTTDKDSYAPKGDYKLYYVVNIRAKGELATGNSRAELYEYNCNTKTPKLLLQLKIHGDGNSYYTVDYENKGNLLLAQKYFGASDGGTERVLAYNVYLKKTLLDIDWLGHEGGIDGFVDSRNFWYLYFPSVNFQQEGTLYRINKKTKKITKL